MFGWQGTGFGERTDFHETLGRGYKTMPGAMERRGEKRTVVGKRILISSVTNNSNCGDCSSLNKQRPGRRKVESSGGISHGLSMMMMLSALLTKAVALGVAVPASTSAAAAAVTGSGVAVVSSPVEPSPVTAGPSTGCVVTDAKMSSSVISKAGEVPHGTNARRRLQVRGFWFASGRWGVVEALPLCTRLPWCWCGYDGVEAGERRGGKRALSVEFLLVL